VQIEIVGTEQIEELRGTVVVIDVLRAFTTAAYAFGAGAAEILLVGTTADAFALRADVPAAFLVGEEGGYPIEGFDFCNSPFEVAGSGLDGADLIMRTTAGTRAVVRARGARSVLCASFVCAEATVRRIARMSPSHLHLVVSGRDRPAGGADDLACADYLAARLRGERPPAKPFLDRVRDSSAADKFLDPSQTDFRIEDLELALELDRFDFAMEVRPRDRLLVLEKVGTGAPATAIGD